MFNNTQKNKIIIQMITESILKIIILVETIETIMLNWTKFYGFII